MTDVLQIRLKADQDKLKGLKWGDYRRMKNDPEAQHHFVSMFLVDAEGQSLSQSDADALLDELTIEQVGDLFGRIQSEMETAVVPNGQGGTSG